MSKIQVVTVADGTEYLRNTRAEFDELETKHGADAIVAFGHIIVSAKFHNAIEVPELVKSIDTILAKRAREVFYAQQTGGDVTRAYEQSDQIKIFKYGLYLNDKREPMTLAETLETE